MTAVLASAVRDWNLGHLFMRPWFWAAFFSWMAAQAIKMVIAAVRTRRFDFEYFVSTGGMPSAHSALVLGLATSIGLTEGFGAPVTMLAIGVAAITTFDAATVRHAAGEQAKVLNQMMREIKERNFLFQGQHLKELLGHTRKEVLCGMATGVCVAVAVCRLWPAL